MMLALLLAAEEPPAAAASAPTEALKQVVVDAIRNCGKSQGDEIVVCSRDRGLAESYRLPKIQPRLAEAGKTGGKLEALAGAGAAGQGTCTATGGAGTTGCSLAQANAWAEWKKRQKAAGEGWFPW